MKIYLTNPEKILFEKLKINKKMLAEYYFAIKDWILPHIINRPISLFRCPNGASGDCFYQRLYNETLSNEIYPINFQHHSKKTYFYIKNFQGLMSIVQLGTLEIHIWNCKVNDMSHPDQMILDLDPDVNFSFSQIVNGAFIIKKFLDAMKLKSFVKTTGRKGLNIAIPLANKNSSSDVLEFAGSIAKFLSNKHPELFIATMSKKSRQGRIFIDYLRNAPESTFIAPFSTRATETVGIATPISWRELKKISSGNYINFTNILSVLSKQKKDPWQNFFKSKQNISKQKINLENIIK